MSFERSYSIESHERIKLILIFGDKSLLLTCWVTYTLSCLAVMLVDLLAFYYGYHQFTHFQKTIQAEMG